MSSACQVDAGEHVYRCQHAQRLEVTNQSQADNVVMFDVDTLASTTLHAESSTGTRVGKTLPKS
jgi:membrane-bound inhibitor of C-type lysozyme